MPNIDSKYRHIHLDVTQELINLAKPRDSGHCAVADALKAAVPNATGVSVDLQTIRFTIKDQNKRYIYLTPAGLQTLLVDFDQGIPPRVGVYRLGRPAQIVTSRKSKGGSHRKVVEQTTAEGGGEGRTSIVVKEGSLPPTAALSNTRGRRRTYGLRTLRP